MTIDVSGIDFANRNDDVPLFKVGKASILPARGDVVISGELPAPWRLAKTPYGLGYRLNRIKGAMIIVNRERSLSAGTPSSWRRSCFFIPCICKIRTFVLVREHDFLIDLL